MVLERNQCSLVTANPFYTVLMGNCAPEGFILSPQLESCGHIVKGVSWSGGHVVLRNWHQQGKTGYHLKEKTGSCQGNVATAISPLVCQVTTMDHILTTAMSPLRALTLALVLNKAQLLASLRPGSLLTTVHV